MEQKLKVGCIGMGPRGRELFRLLVQRSDVEAYAVCDCEEECLAAAREMIEQEAGIRGVRYFSSFEEMLQTDVEAVIVATNVSSHCEIAVKCLEAGRHVLCEIPVIASVDEAKLLRDAVEAHPQQMFMVGENCCYWAFVDTWKKMVEEGLLGDVIYAEADYLHSSRAVDSDRPYSWRSFLSAITYLTHNLGPLLYMLEDSCEEVSGFIPGINPIREAHPAPPDGLAILKTAKGTLIKIFIGFGVKHRFAHNFALYGSKGSLERQRGKRFEENATDAYLESIPHTQKEIEIPVTVAYPGESAASHGGSDAKMLEEFVHCIRAGIRPKLDAEFGIKTALPGILADISSKHDGRKFRVPDIRDL